MSGGSLAAVIAVLTAAAGAPAATSADPSEAASLIRAPSTPTVTTWPWLVSGVPSAPRMAARAGQVVRRDSWSPAPSRGAIVAGDHFTSHLPCTSTSRREDLMVTVPRPASVSRSVTGALAAELFVCIRPAAKLAWRTVRLRNAAWFTDREVGRRVAGQLPHRRPVLPGPGRQVGVRRRLRQRR